MAATTLVSVAIIVVTAQLTENDADLWLNLASECAGLLLGGSVVAYFLHRLREREDGKRKARETAGLSAGAARMMNRDLGGVVLMVAIRLTRPLGLDSPKRGAPLIGETTSLAAQLEERFADGGTFSWDVDGDGGEPGHEHRTRVRKDQMLAGRAMLNVIVRAQTRVRESVVPLVLVMNDLALLEVLSEADLQSRYYKDRVEDWSDDLPVSLGPLHVFAQLPALLRTYARAVALIEQRTELEFVYEGPPRPKLV